MALLDGPESEQERTESPTPKRREEARREGRIPRSQELSAACLLLAAACALGAAAGGRLGHETGTLLTANLGRLAADPLTVGSAGALVRESAGHLLTAMLPFLATIMIVSLFVGVVQGQGVISLKPLEPRLSNVSPLSGIGRILSLQSAFTLVKALIKFAVLGAVTYLALRKAWPQVTSLAMGAPAETLAVIRQLGFRLALSVGLAFLLLALADYGFEVYRYEQSLKMTKQQVRQEHKESEGDPIVKSRIRSLQRATSRKRMLKDVGKADVVVTNPTHIAVALKYDAEAASAPIVLAMGERKLAERIKALAAQAGVPMVENRPLAHALLATAKVGKQIPATLYAAVAEVLAYVYRRNGGGPK
jgi:flagellar biosynthetic protein FlhB